MVCAVHIVSISLELLDIRSFLFIKKKKDTKVVASVLPLLRVMERYIIIWTVWLELTHIFITHVFLKHCLGHHLDVHELREPMVSALP